MAKTTIKTYFTSVMDGRGENEIIRVNGSAEQCQGYVPGIVTLKYSGLSIPAGKKAIKHTIKLHLGSPSSKYCYYSTSYPAPPDGYATQEATSSPRNLEVNPSPAIPVRGFAYMQYTAGYANIIKEYNNMPSEIASGDWISLELPREQNLPSDGSIYLTQMSAYTPASNPIENRLPGKVAYKYSDVYYYNFINYFWANFTDYELSNRSCIETVIADCPQIPTTKSPILGETVAPSGGVVRFSWAHNPSPQSNLPQKGYNLQISGDGLTWETITATSTNQYADVPVAKIPSGNFYWRVQTVDTDDAPSDYSDQAYAYYGTAPTAPSIVTSVFTSAKPRLIWTTTFTQSAYKVQILKGATYIVDITAESSDQFYDIPVALENGEQYTVRVSARDEAAHYSAWAEDAITANYIIPTTPSFMLSKKKDSIDIVISHNQTGILRYDIYRFAPGDTDFIRIGSTTTKKYKDWSVMAGNVRYKVIAVSDSGESKAAQQQTVFELTTGWLTPVDDPAHPFEVRYNVQDRYHTDYDVSMMEYAGREKPVAEFGQIAQRSISVSFATNDKDAYKALERVIRQRKTVLYRNARMKMYGVCISPSDQPADYYGMIYNLSFVINEVEHSEVG
nr:MAG TPA: Interleukin-6 receptor subunit beta Receptor, Fibronectin Type III [Caudoviricetes sp.]